MNKQPQFSELDVSRLSDLFLVDTPRALVEEKTSPSVFQVHEYEQSMVSNSFFCPRPWTRLVFERGGDPLSFWLQSDFWTKIVIRLHPLAIARVTLICLLFIYLLLFFFAFRLKASRKSWQYSCQKQWNRMYGNLLQISWASYFMVSTLPYKGVEPCRAYQMVVGYKWFCL